MWPEFREERKPGTGPTYWTGTSVTMEMIQATAWDLLSAGDGLYLRQPRAKPSSCQLGSLCGVLGPRTGLALLETTVLGGPGLSRALLFSSALFSLSLTRISSGTQGSSPSLIQES